jgi:hypothetical protein
MSDVTRNAWGTTIFCEDIRAEVDGKITLVGVYPSEMQVHAPFPLTMPKFGLWIRYIEVPNTMAGDGKLYVWLPGEGTPTVETNVPINRTEIPSKPQIDMDDISERLLMMQIPLLISPMVLQRPGRIRVRMHFDKMVVGLGALRILEAPPPGPSG